VIGVIHCCLNFDCDFCLAHGFVGEKIIYASVNRPMRMNATMTIITLG
jgi:hypothetical protein